MGALLSVQPRLIGEKGSEATPDQIVLKIAKEIEQKIP